MTLTASISGNSSPPYRAGTSIRKQPASTSWSTRSGGRRRASSISSLRRRMWGTSSVTRSRVVVFIVKRKRARRANSRSVYPGGVQAGYRIGVDIGGTFTDLVLLARDGSVSTRKLPTSPTQHGRVVVDGLASLLNARRLEPEEVSELVHGTTVATNAVLEAKGARTGLLTTRGFRDVL